MKPNGSLKVLIEFLKKRITKEKKFNKTFLRFLIKIK